MTPDAKVHIFSKPDCKWCDVAKAALRTRGIEWTETDVTSALNGMVEFKASTNNATTVPQITVGKHLVGGATDLLAIIDTRKFKQLLEEV